jgi:ppGpp synthetase/RelA/SpoT-type nucleotidyltranferase
VKEDEKFDFATYKRELLALGLGKLPDEPHRYFLEPEGTVFIELSQLVPTRARTKGIVNANTLMRQAYDEQIEKRAPISVELGEKNRYVIQDGNSTYANAVLSEWREIPCIANKTGLTGNAQEEMMVTSYEDVKIYHKTRASNTEACLLKLDKALSEARDDKGIALYGTKWRIKAIDSIYLKLRRKKIELAQITDFGGMRLLCMFEQDLLPVHRALLIALKKRYELHEIEIHNLNDVKLERELEESANDIADKAKDYKFKTRGAQGVENAVSGYKSIHYSVSWSEDGVPYFIEIQLRTIVQEAWAELSHTLSYKRGRIHSHVSNGFDLLARDLSKADKLLTHLRHTSDLEQAIDSYTLSKLGPYNVFWYESDVLPPPSNPNKKIHRAFKRYQEHVCIAADGNLSAKDQKEWIIERWNLYVNLITQFTGDTRTTKNLKEWKLVEEAYFMFSGIDVDTSLKEGKLVKSDPDDRKVWLRDHVLTKYRSIDRKNSNDPNIFRCIANFRMGEIYYLLGELENALQHFDRSERLLPTGDMTKRYLCRSKYYIVVRLAGIYWRIGNEYLNLALEKIQSANEIVRKNNTYFNQLEKDKLVNNTCWYTTEYFNSFDTDKKDEKNAAFEIANNNFEKLRSLLESGPSTSNAFDTAAWFCFSAYKYKKDKELLSLARKYCDQMWDKKNEARDYISSVEIQRRHTQEILVAKGELGK